MGKGEGAEEVGEELPRNEEKMEKGVPIVGLLGLPWLLSLCEVLEGLACSWWFFDCFRQSVFVIFLFVVSMTVRFARGLRCLSEA